jgi:diguanylate cyclase (GGDEF)-like protein/PAS domain S-box-containing protein
MILSPASRISPGLVEILSDNSIGLMVTGADRRLLFCNAKFTEITGYEMAEMVGRDCTFLQGAGTSADTVRRIGEALRNEHSFSGDILNYRKDGTPFWNELTMIPQHDETGALTNFIGLFRNVAGHRATGDSAILLNENVQFVLDHLHSGIVLHGHDTRIVYANPAAAALLGLQADRMKGLASDNEVWCFTDGDGAALAVDQYPASLAVSSGKPVKNLVVGTRKVENRAQVWLLCNAYPVPDADGRVREVIVSFNDITDLRTATLEREKTEERLHLILRGTNDALWDWDIASSDLYYSERWWAMMGMTPPRAAAPPHFWLERIHGDDRIVVKERLAHWIAADTETFEIEFRLFHEAGYYIPVLCRGAIARDAQGDAVRMSGAIMDLTERKRHEAQLHDFAHRDPLTGLANRRLFNQKLGETLRRRNAEHPAAALLCIDLFDLKRCNDAYGYETGDKILKTIGQRLKQFDIGTDMIARLGSDEFAIIFEDLGVDRPYTAFMAGKIAADILRAINEPINLGDAVQVMTACIGIVIIDEHDHDMTSVLKQAEAAMYNAKEAGPGALRFFDPKIQDDLEERLLMASEFRNALQTGELEPYYQAKVRDGVGIIGAELLIRWAHPTRGQIGPAVFVPFCEENGLIVGLGQYVLRLACQQLRKWAAIPGLSHLSLSVNVSIGELQDVDYEENFVRILKQSGANPDNLILEITESVLADDTDTVNVKIQRLREMGVRFALDDFGTGYSSLSMLLQIKLDELKIDRSFVTAIPDNLNACKVSGIIIDLARQLGMNVVAEGIETEAQLAFLRSRTCSVFQGYLFAKPTTLREFEVMARQDVEELSFVIE